MKNLLLEQSLAVRTFVLPEVETAIKDIVPTYDTVRHYKSEIKNWLKPIVDLSNFYVYPMNGITEGLNWWYNREHRGVWLAQGDYQWIDLKGKGSPYIRYQSVPSAIDGNFKEIDHTMPLALDLAYVGSTAVRKLIIPDNVEFVFYSLSKSFGVSNIRTGWLFCKKQDSKLEALTYSAKYYNYFAHSIAEKIISNFDIDFVHKSLYNKQKEICSALELCPSDSVWLATTTDKAYSKFRRQGDVARICLSGVYK